MMARPEILGILHNTGFPAAETSALASSQFEVVEAESRDLQSVTNGSPRPSFFVQATESTFRVCVTPSQRPRTTCMVEQSGCRRLGRDSLSEQRLPQEDDAQGGLP